MIQHRYYTKARPNQPALSADPTRFDATARLADRLPDVCYLTGFFSEFPVDRIRLYFRRFRSMPMMANGWAFKRIFRSKYFQTIASLVGIQDIAVSLFIDLPTHFKPPLRTGFHAQTLD